MADIGNVHEIYVIEESSLKNDEKGWGTGEWRVPLYNPPLFNEKSIIFDCDTFQIFRPRGKQKGIYLWIK